MELFFVLNFCYIGIHNFFNFSGERLFPPQSGLTFCSWVCVDKFSAPSSDPHRVRLLTIVRHIQGRDDHLICLNVFLSPRDRALFVCTTEFSMPTAGLYNLKR